MNSIYHFNRLRDMLNEYEPSRELSLVKTKIDEAELWLTKCRPTIAARERDQMSSSNSE
ncbi:MAG: hypothetical protein HMLIMOIP_002082 [Candidatus Nitrosomirales archaeon]|jgi:hypothetical protein